MNIVLNPSTLSGELSVPASKSLSHRYLIAAALAKGESTIKNLLNSNDIVATKKALIALGAMITDDIINGGFPKKKASQINAGASGSTLRFMIPIAMLQNEAITFYGEDRLPMRSLSVYEELFKNKGYHYERLSEHHLPLKVKGPLQSGTYTLRGDISSQFITGLLFALPLVEGNSTLHIKEPFESKAYVQLTLEVLQAYGITITHTHNTFQIPGNQHYRPIQTTIEGDYSSAAFFIVGGLINALPLTLHNLKDDSSQGDKAILSIIDEMGGKYERNAHGLTVHPSTLTATTIDLQDIPDLGPVLMVLAALSEGETTFTSIERLRYKESDRVEAMEVTLKKLGVHVITTENTMTVTGQKSLRGGQSFDPFNDHRIAMAIMIASLRCDAPITIKNIEVINKSYPTFLETFTTLGGNIQFKEEGRNDE